MGLGKVVKKSDVSANIKQVGGVSDLFSRGDVMGGSILPTISFL
jgi:hypothetical protein